MEAIKINYNGLSSDIFIESSLERLRDLLPESNVVIIIDENVNSLYGHIFSQYKLISIRSGEPEKTLNTLAGVYAKLIEFEADRHTFILGVGGGIVCDIAGFIASTYMRGVRFGFVATTLVAQVDAAIGGKNGVNFQRYKNIIGTFNQPEFVICDVRFLKTLSNRELNAGFAEIIKYGLISDKSIIDDVGLNHRHYSNCDLDAFKKLIAKCVAIKANIVNEDVNEKGRRKILNFGHTFGHAIEKISSEYNHGEAISIGMVIALKISQIKGNISNADMDRICALLHQYYLPISIDEQLFPALIESLAADKKRNQSSIDYIILNQLGEAVILTISLKELSDMLKKISFANPDKF
ncbi:MAG TPA: 3-dehydroquinate synthase [Bacteroidales bacterium]